MGLRAGCAPLQSISESPGPNVSVPAVDSLLHGVRLFVSRCAHQPAVTFLFIHSQQSA